jgi:hydroxymethylbilane synthase
MEVPDPLVLGTRNSELALWQANYVRSKLEANGHRVQIEEITTRGDRVQDVPVSEMGDESVFTKELDRALLTGDVHLAVHSLKDVPSQVPTGIQLAAVTERGNPHDAFVAHPSFDGGLDDLPEGATVATASLRRKAQLRAWRPDLEVVPVRGNVDTRLEKLDASTWDGMILAVAGLVRLGRSPRIRETISETVMVPAVGQGALGIACASENGAVAAALRSVLHHEPSAAAARAERSFLRYIGGGCQVPLGAWARPAGGDTLLIDGCIVALDGSEVYRDRRTCPAEAGEREGVTLARDLMGAGGEEIIRDILGNGARQPPPIRP